MILKSLVRRLVQALFMVWIVGTATFAFTHLLPGDAAFRIAADRYGDDYVDSELAEKIRIDLGLDRPWYEQYLDWLRELFVWNFGNSLVYENPVSDILTQGLGYTLGLALLALLASLLIAIPSGILLAIARKKWLDNLMILFGTSVRSLPPFILAVLLIIFFSVQLDWLPATGSGKPIHFLLPAGTLALGLIAVAIPITRNATLQVLNSEYYQFSAIKGLGRVRSFFRHAFRNLIIPVIAYHGTQFVYLIEGVIVVESVFAWPGIGHAMVHAIISRDVPVIQGTAMIMAFGFILLNFGLDLIYTFIDPRKSSEES